MSGSDADNDKTQIRPPAKSAQKIPDRYQASVVVIKGHAEGMEYALTKEHTVIGRDKSADIALKDAQISRQHVAIVYHDGSFVLRDLQSTNGTMLNGAIIEQADIRHKDKFRIGETTLQFILENTGKSRTYDIE